MVSEERTDLGAAEDEEETEDSNGVIRLCILGALARLGATCWAVPLVMGGNDTAAAAAADGDSFGASGDVPSA
jgi:hypothetical protein